MIFKVSETLLLLLLLPLPAQSEKKKKKKKERNSEILAKTTFPPNMSVAQEHNLDQQISVLSEAFEKSRYSRDANYTLLNQYAQSLSQMLKQFREYKARHVADVSAWHRSYRDQLAEARAENARLRDQIWEMQEHAGKCNTLVRDFRTRFQDNPANWQKKMENVAMRQEIRFWKRMALRSVVAEDDTDFWSDDDDVIDKAEKERLRDEDKKLAAQQAQDILYCGMDNNDDVIDPTDAFASLIGPDRSQVHIPEALAGGQAGTGSLMFKDFTLMAPAGSGITGSIPPEGILPRPGSSTGSTGSSGQ